MTIQPLSAFTDDALGGDDALGVAARIRSREVSPREVTEAAINRSRTLGDALNAVAEDRYGRALADADRAPTGVFGGVPTFIKDMLGVQGMRTTHGSRSLASTAPRTTTDPFVQQYLDMGVVNLGMSTMPEFGFTASTEFPDGTATHNPWNPRHTPGGSSGGSAALVAAGVVPIAHTADGGGSTRIPAGCNGLVGLKPSTGRLTASASNKQAIVQIVVDGVATRSVRDTIAYYAAAEQAYRNPSLPPIGTIDRPVDRPLRIGATTTTQGAGYVDAATQREFDRTVALLESLGHRVERFEFDIYDRFSNDFILYWAFGGYAFTKLGRKLLDPAFDRDAVTDLTNSLARRFRRELLHFPGAIRRLRAFRHGYTEAMGDYDVVLTPTTGQLSPELGHLGMGQRGELVFSRVEQWACFTPICNASGAPSLSLPLGHDDEHNLPVGMCFHGHHGAEALLLELALQLEEAAPFRTLANATTKPR